MISADGNVSKIAFKVGIFACFHAKLTQTSLIGRKLNLIDTSLYMIFKT